MSNHIWNYRRLPSRIRQAIKKIERDPSVIVVLPTTRGDSALVVSPDFKDWKFR